jgi:AbrB family looped-hinge helix DNA binding protein
MIYGMTITIDKAGRIVVPKALRQRLSLSPNSELEIVDHPDGLLLRVPKSGPTLLAVNGLLVHQGLPEKNADWEGLLNSVREERIRETS